MNQLHVVTVGISLLTNYAKASNLPLERVLRRHKQLAEFLKTDPRAACSEINSLEARTGLLRKKNKGLTVSLVYSATARLAEAGLIRLYDTLEAHVRKLRARHPDLEIAFNATGGFKAETAILYGLGLELGISVYYLHETYKVPIVLPVCAAPF